jgi:hypothetical protein
VLDLGKLWQKTASHPAGGPLLQRVPPGVVDMERQPNILSRRIIGR